MFNLQQARALSRYCEVRAVAPVQWFPVSLWHGARPNAVPAYEEMAGIPTWHPRYFLTPRIARDLYPLQMAASLLPTLARVRREYPFDVLLATWAFPDVVVGAMAAKLWNLPLIAKVHGSDINVQATYPGRRKQIAWALRRAHKVLAVSAALRDKLVDMGVRSDQVLTFHNGVDRESFHPGNQAQARREAGISVNGKHVLFVGFLAEAKALHVLLQALVQLREQGRLDFTTHLVGAGPMNRPLREQAELLGLGEAVQFHGERTHDQVPIWMRAADVFCLPSIREGCPNVILEALASGRPVVSTTVGGIPEMVTPENALLVPPGEPAPLAAALRTALDRKWDETALVRSVDHFDWDHSARALFHAAEEALAARPPKPAPRSAFSGAR